MRTGTYGIEEQGRIVPISVELVDALGSDVNIVNAARVSFAKEVREVGEADQKLMRYLWKHKHWTPFAHTCITLRCKAPIFLARQLVKHQVGFVWNEESRRYISTEPEYYIPDVLHFSPENAKQGAGAEFNKRQYQEKIDRLIQNTDECDSMYLCSVRSGMAPEEARMFLPLNTHTNWVWSGSLVAFMRVIEQRSDSHAQGAAQEFAKLLRAAISGTYPMAIAAYNEVHNGCN
jgi:thymidylate synthase (FAD)